MLLTKPVTLDDLECYARKYFPDEFSRLPFVTFEGHLNGLGHRLNYMLELSDGNRALLQQGALIQLE